MHEAPVNAYEDFMAHKIDENENFDCYFFTNFSRPWVETFSLLTHQKGKTQFNRAADEF